MIGDLIEKCLWEINDLRQRRPDVYRQIEVLILAIMDHLETFRLVVDCGCEGNGSSTHPGREVIHDR